MATEQSEPAEDGHPERPASRQGRAAGCLAIVLLVAAVPLTIIGLLLRSESEAAGAAHSGVGGGLAGLSSVIAYGILFVAALCFTIGLLLLLIGSLRTR